MIEYRNPKKYGHNGWHAMGFSQQLVSGLFLALLAFYTNNSLQVDCLYASIWPIGFSSDKEGTRTQKANKMLSDRLNLTQLL